MKYYVRNIEYGNLCGPVGGNRNYIQYSVLYVKGGTIFETYDINIAFHYRKIMDKENPTYKKGYEVIEVE